MIFDTFVIITREVWTGELKHTGSLDIFCIKKVKKERALLRFPLEVSIHW